MPGNITARRLINTAEEQFRKADLCYGHGTDNSHDEAVYLVLGALGFPFDVNDRRLDEPLEAAKTQHIQNLVVRRIAERVPVAYLINEAWFCGLSFYVDKRVIIPRSPLAELIEEKFAPWMLRRGNFRILDIGVGSGCIAIACAMAFPDADIDAVDIDEDAIAVGKINVDRYQVSDRVHLIRSDLYENLNGNRYDLIVANPPYVGSRELSELPEEYRHEPAGALYGGQDGLDLVRKILLQSRAHLTDTGILVVEVGNNQEAVTETFPQLPFVWLEFERGGEGVFLLTSEDLVDFKDSLLG